MTPTVRASDSTPARPGTLGLPPDPKLPSFPEYAIAQYEAAYEALSQGAKNRLDYCDDCLKRAAYVPLLHVCGEPMRCCASCARDLVARELVTVLP